MASGAGAGADTGAGAAEVSLGSLAWLEGDWLRQTKQGEATESWKTVSEDTMEGVAWVTSGDSSRITEYLRLERFGEEIFFTAKPGQNPFPTAFLMIECGEQRAVFENTGHDFPQRIIYTRNEEGGLTVRIEGAEDGEARGVDFVFERKR